MEVLTKVSRRILYSVNYLLPSINILFSNTHKSLIFILEARLALAMEIGVKLGVLHSNASFMSEHYKPNVVIYQHKLIAGRTSLSRSHNAVASIDR